MVGDRTLGRITRLAAIIAALTGGFGTATLLGAFGPVDCWTAHSASSSGMSATTHGCEAGVDYLFGQTAGNAPVLFFWAMVLLGLVAVGAIATWTGHRFVAWATGIVGGAITLLGLLSIGWLFLLPTLCLLLGAGALTVRVRRLPDKPSA